ncbi:hypothetical protein Ahy_B03g065312 isoform A [Arachis hypogaea]|uniref:PB1 domain-containing protein n=1 Tax=Arachis hypogaea TaxID=3818 RepID=A0A445A1A9_ARAHY|nr:hypothetical protein Ahy_B03g065312 isoform A [Arachis hypogaea]
MANEERFVVLMHYRGSIKKKTRSGIKFTDKDPLSIFLKPSTSFNEFLNSIIQKLGLQGVKRVEKLLYGIPISVLQDDVKYNSLVIGSDEDLEVLFHCRQQFPEVRTPELLAKLVDVVSSSGGSNRNPQAVATAACSTSRPSGALSSMPVIAPEAMLVASPSFAVDLNRSGDGAVGIVDTAPVSLHGFAPDGVDDVLRDDDEDDDMEPDMIADKSGEDIVQADHSEHVGFGAKGTQQGEGVTEF